MNQKITLILLASLTGLGVWARLTGLDWDGMNLLHPDERFLVMLLPRLDLPSSVFEYLNTPSSPLNPHNRQTPFYVYGPLPLLLMKFISASPDLHQLLLLGRQVTAVLEVAIVACVYFLGRCLGGRLLGLTSATCYSLSALPIQLARFFTIDPFMVFFGTLSLCLLLYAGKRPYLWILSGTFLGAAISSKISAVFFVLPLIILLIVKIFSSRRLHHPLRSLALAGLLVVSALFSLRFFYPYLFDGPVSFNPRTMANFSELRSWESATVWFPPAVQWTSITPGVFPLVNLAIVGLGLPLFVLAALGLVSLSLKVTQIPLLAFIPVGIIGLFAYISLQFAQPLRYLYPVYPLLAICAGWSISHLLRRRAKLALVLLIVISIWPLSVASIYTRPHPRVAASEWIKSHLPPNSTLSCDHWDDCLPVGYHPQYRHIELPMFDFETPSKWQTINQKLAAVDYLVISSNRVYASTQNDPRYSPTRQFYENLFSGRLSFTLIAQFASRPAIATPLINLCVPLPFLNYGLVAAPITTCQNLGLEFIDDYADETWTVYDHPKVFIFQNSPRQKSQFPPH